MRRIGSVIALIVFALSAFGSETQENPVAALPPQAKIVEGILVPIPKEVFRSLDEFQNANWAAVQRVEITRWRSHGDEVQIALLLGSVVAEGFIAMEAEDSNEAQKVGKKALALARALGVEHSVLRRSRSIMDCTDRGDWAEARMEWDGVLADLEQGMIKIESKPLLQLVSLGGWLRGTDALCVLVLQDYTPERAALVRQPAMLDQFERQLKEIPGKKKNHSMVGKMLDGLQKVRSLLGTDDAGMSQQTVKEIGRICKELVALTSGRPG